MQFYVFSTQILCRLYADSYNDSTQILQCVLRRSTVFYADSTEFYAESVGFYKDSTGLHTDSTRIYADASMFYADYIVSAQIQPESTRIPHGSTQILTGATPILLVPSRFDAKNIYSEFSLLQKCSTLFLIFKYSCTKHGFYTCSPHVFSSQDLYGFSTGSRLVLLNSTTIFIFKLSTVPLVLSN